MRPFDRNVEKPRGRGACAAPRLTARPVAREPPAPAFAGDPPGAAPRAPSVTPAPALRGALWARGGDGGGTRAPGRPWTLFGPPTWPSTRPKPLYSNVRPSSVLSS